MRQNGPVPARVTVAWTLPCGSVEDVTVAAPAGVTRGGVQLPGHPPLVRVIRSRVPAFTQAVDSHQFPGPWMMVTVPDGHPFSTGTGPVGIGVSEPVMRSGVIVGPGLPGTDVPMAEPGVPVPGADAPGTGEAQDTAAADSNTHTAVSRTPLVLSGPIGDRCPPVVDVRHVP